MQVRVQGWATPRSILEENGNILFEVAEADGCPTCQRRIAHVRRTLAAKNISADFRAMSSAYSDRCLYVVLGAPPQGVDVKDYVGQILDLSIG